MTAAVDERRAERDEAGGFHETAQVLMPGFDMFDEDGQERLADPGS
ncbi:hypothetical protein [Streptomyces sp. NPDC089799]